MTLKSFKFKANKLVQKSVTGQKPDIILSSYL